jgi:hypothetical protein
MVWIGTSLHWKLKSHYIIINSDCDLDVYFETMVLCVSCHKMYCISLNIRGGFPFVPTPEIATQKSRGCFMSRALWHFSVTCRDTSFPGKTE